MANRIELTDLELKVLKQELRHEFSLMTATMEEADALDKVLDKCYDLMDELKAHKESGPFPLVWFYKKYQAQQKAQKQP